MCNVFQKGNFHAKSWPAWIDLRFVPALKRIGVQITRELCVDRDQRRCQQFRLVSTPAPRPLYTRFRQTVTGLLRKQTILTFLVLCEFPTLFIINLPAHKLSRFSNVFGCSFFVHLLTLIYRHLIRCQTLQIVEHGKINWLLCYIFTIF